MSIYPAQLAEYRLLLEQKKNELSEVRTTGEQSADTVQLDQSRVGRLSRMDAMQAQAVYVETNRRRAIEMQRIDAAMARVDAGTFGTCQACEAEIAAARLRLDPATPVCIDCAREAGNS